MQVVDKPVPRIEHADDVVLRVTRTAICGSDLHLYHGLVPDTRVGATLTLISMSALTLHRLARR
ncbi:MAG TPA: alcohol dehydrogenase catalytic domain-containing protein [Polyangiaceae bacterium]|nr:alcohol dehydrogenase catalytic domain-containing protein [Polyangiaceae bacterium]